MVNHVLPISQIYRTGFQPVKAQIVTYAQEQDAAIDAEVLRAQSAESNLNAYITAVAIDAGATGAIVLWEPGTVDSDVVSLPVSPTANQRVLNLTDKKLYQRMADNSDWMPPLTPAGGEQIYSRADKLTRIFDTASWSYAQPMMPTVVPGTGNATTNRAAIQTALDNGGHVYVGGNGIIYIDGPLVIYSNSFLEVNPKCIITLAPAGNGNLVQSSASQAAWTNVTVTWVAGLACTVNWAGHGFSPGDYVSLEGIALWCLANADGTATLSGTDINPATSGVVAGMLVVGPGSAIDVRNTVVSVTSNSVTAFSAINGGSPGTGLYYMLQTDPAFFETLLVETVATNSFTVRLTQLPIVAPAGQMRARQANVNIKISGRFDGNHRNGANASGAGTNRMGLSLFSVQRLDLDVSVQDCVEYVINTGGLRDFIMAVDVPFNTKDGVKIFGPAFNGEITRLSGNAADDNLSLQALSPPTFLADTQPNRGGSIKGVHAKNLDCGGHSSFHTYGHPAFLIDNSGCENVNSPNVVAARPVMFDTNQTDMVGYYGRVYAKNIYAEDLNTFGFGLVAIVGPVVMKSALIEGVSLPQISGIASAAEGAVSVDVKSSVDVLTIKNVVGGLPKNVSCINISGQANHIVLEDFSVNTLDSGARLLNLAAGSSTTTIEIRGGDSGACKYLICQNPGTLTSPNISFFNHNSSCLTACFITGGATVSALAGGRFDSLTDGFVQAISSGVSLFANASVSVPAGQWQKLVTGGTISAIIDTLSVPGTAGAAGEKGMRTSDASYIYECTATNTWKRVAIATW